MRSLRTRLVVVAVLVAALAVAATAWAVNRTTSSQVRRAVEEDVEAEEAIYEELGFHVFSTGSWSGVEEVVTELAQRHEERVALTTVEGDVIADSAELLDREELPLPRSPARFIDPGSPVIRFDEPAGALRERLARFAGLGPDLAEALEEAGVSFSLREDFGLSYPVWDPGDPAAGPVIGRFLFEEFIGGGMPLPDEGVDVLNAEAEALADFLAELGIDFEVVGGARGPRYVAWDVGDELAGTAVEEFFSQRGPEEILDLVDVPILGAVEPAEPALLFLGVGEEEGALPDPIGWRLLLIVGGLVVLAVVAMSVASRQVLGPVAQVTRAARRMEAGDLGERVPVGGTEEVATLAGAFNAMADSLEAQDRLRKSMTGDIAHELRTPLSNIRGYLEAIQEGVVEPSREMIDSIHEEAVQLQRLVDELAVLASAEAGDLPIDPAPTELGELLERVVLAHRARADTAGIVLELDADPAVTAWVDGGRLRQVVGNLLDNALRHTRRGDRIEVRLEGGDDRATITVGDTGPGIGAEHLPHLFDRLYRVDPSRSRETGGSGLGLAIARELVRLHGGDITVASEPGRGTSFTLWVPREQPDAGSGVTDPATG